MKYKQNFPFILWKYRPTDDPNHTINSLPQKKNSSLKLCLVFPRYDTLTDVIKHTFYNLFFTTKVICLCNVSPVIISVLQINIDMMILM